MQITLIIILAVLIPIAAIGTLLGWIYYGGPILRNRPYRELIADFQHAQRINHRWRGCENAGWDFSVQLAEVQTKIQVQADPSGAVRINYEDEGNERILFDYVDYNYLNEIRMAGNILFVYRTESLFHTDHWLLAYDLIGRRDIIRRRVDPADMAQAP